MRCYTEPPIPPFFVGVEVDGCLNHAVSHPDAAGTEEQCLAFIAAHLPPKGAELVLAPMDGGHLPSFSYQPAARRVRLNWQDCCSI